jgi:hypothetical protein
MQKSRSLTSLEVSLASSIFSNSIDYSKVKIHDKKFVVFQPNFSGMTPNGEIFVHGSYRSDYSLVNDELKSFFIHEMVHVYQYQLKILNPIGSAISSAVKNRFDYAKAYHYKLEPNRDLLEYGIEQQAQIIEDFYRIRILNIKPFNGYMKNKIENVKHEMLFEKVLKRFLSDPNYARHNFECKRKLSGKIKKVTCARVLV